MNALQFTKCHQSFSLTYDSHLISVLLVTHAITRCRPSSFATRVNFLIIKTNKADSCLAGTVLRATFICFYFGVNGSFPSRAVFHFVRRIPRCHSSGDRPLPSLPPP